MRRTRFGWLEWLLWIGITINASLLGLVAATAFVAVCWYIGATSAMLANIIFSGTYCALVVFVQWLMLQHYVHSAWALPTGVGSLFCTLAAIALGDAAGLAEAFPLVVGGGVLYGALSGLLVLMGVSPRHTRAHRLSQSVYTGPQTASLETEMKAE
jgi:hypothetical protein